MNLENTENGTVSPTRIYHLYGIRMVSAYHFRHTFIEDSGIPDVRFACSTNSPVLVNWEICIPDYIDRNSGNRDRLVSIHRSHKCHIARFLPIDFFVGPDTIDAHLRDASFEYMLEIWLLGKVFSLWLELRGIPCLHASSVVVNHEAIGFLSLSHRGKSVLAASFMRAGYPLLTDDILPVKREEVYRGMPGYPSMRMWPDQAEYFLGNYEHLELVQPTYSKRVVPIGPDSFGTFCSEAQELKVLYIPEKQSSSEEITIEAISAKDAFFELVKNSFTAKIVEALGLQPQRMKFFEDMVMQIPLRRLRYPTGFQHLSRVKDAILEDIESF
jgi:hypothetical protein